MLIDNVVKAEKSTVKGYFYIDIKSEKSYTLLS